MFNEILIMAGLTLLGCISVYGLLFLIFKRNLTTMLWLRLIPGIFILVLTCFLLGKFGVYNITAVVVCFTVAVGTMLCNFIMVTLRLIRPINEIIGGLNEASDAVFNASSQISSASQTLAEGASEQAASIEETSSSLEEMSSMSKQNADNAQQADSLMKESSQVVDQANGAMSRLTVSMEEISRASNETSKIIKTIDEIAFQTNLLALNAAVEAARAGEAGAGFAVVADEVRNLALRAAEAAKRTSDLIEGTVKRINEGSDLVTVTNETFGKVTESSSKVGELVSEIASASNEQAQGTDQINTAVNEMDRVVEQNAANAQESAAASGELRVQAKQMKQMVVELAATVGGGNHKDSAQLEAGSDVFGAQAPNQENLFHNGAPKRSVSVVNKKGELPKQVIPFDDDVEDL